MTKPLKRTIVGLSTLSAITVLRAAATPAAPPAVPVTDNHLPASPSSNPIAQFGGNVVTEAIKIVTGEVDTASAATPCDPKDNTPNRATYCIPLPTPTPVPTATPKPVATATPKPATGSSSGGKSATPTPKPTPTPIVPAAIVSFAASPSSIAGGQTSTLSWVVDGIPHGGCNLNPSPLYSTDGTGSWTTPYLLGSKSYTLTCLGADGRMVYASTSVIVNGIPASQAPDPSIGNQIAASQESFTTDAGQTVLNGLLVTDVKGLVTLNPAIFTDSLLASSVTKVEFYENTTLLQTVDAMPFALDTTKLADGEHTIAQRTYYRDGSMSQNVATLKISNATAGTAGHTVSLSWIFVLLPVVLIAGGLAVRWWLGRRQPGASATPYSLPLRPKPRDNYDPSDNHTGFTS
ncbi:MAG TPA: hypothetical protein VI322_05580 [Candidatus Saccharimonadia bacterium]